jgi:hypothetical protein
MDRESPGGQSDEPGIRRFRAERNSAPKRPAWVHMAIQIGLIGLLLVGIYLIFFTRPDLTGEEFDLRQSIEKIEELSTVRSHLRFGVVVREEAGNLIVRQLAQAAGDIDMDDLGGMLFQDPTLIAELHAVAQYGIRLDDIDERMETDGDTVRIMMPEPAILDVKIVNADTRVVARMQGLFRSSNNELMLEASRRGEKFAEEFARADSSSLALAGTRAREIIAMLLNQAGKEVTFIEGSAAEAQAQ